MIKLNIISLIKLCAFTVFLGRAYQFYFFGAPFRAILWDESLLTPIVEGLFNYSWYDYATSTTVNFWIEIFTKFCSVIFLVSAFVSLFWDKIKFSLLKKTTLYLGTVILVILGICMVKDRNYDYFQFFEMTMQFVAPLIILTNIELNKIDYKKTLIILKIAIALTFIPHGLFAMDVLNLPGQFVDMTILILGVNETQATIFLFVVGLLDVILSVIIFVPRFSKYALMYMVIWGFLTAMARPIAGYNFHFASATLHSSLYLMIYRLSHGIIPLIAYIIEKKLILNQIKIPTHEN